MSDRIERALVTGASSGLGASFARQLAARGVHLVVTARRADRLEALARELSGPGRRRVDVEVVVADLGDEAGLAAVQAVLTRTDDPVDLLVANAGLGHAGPLHELSAAQVGAMLAVDVVAVTRLLHAALPGLRARGRGGALLVGSTAGYQPDPLAAVYGAAKAYVRSLAEAVHEEVRADGVHVMLLSPGTTETEFHELAGLALDRVPGRLRMSADEVVAGALDAFADRRAVHVPGAVNKVLTGSSQVLPSAVSRRVAGVVQRGMLVRP